MAGRAAYCKQLVAINARNQEAIARASEALECAMNAKSPLWRILVDLLFNKPAGILEVEIGGHLSDAHRVAQPITAYPSCGLASRFADLVECVGLPIPPKHCHGVHGAILVGPQYDGDVSLLSLGYALHDASPEEAYWMHRVVTLDVEAGHRFVREFYTASYARVPEAAPQCVNREI